jgi:hypothetical protein
MVEQEVVRQMRALAEAGCGVNRIAREVGGGAQYGVALPARR